MSRKHLAGTVLLENPITSFAIPVLNVEAMFNRTETPIEFLVLDEIKGINNTSKETFQTCWVPTMKKEENATKDLVKAKEIILYENCSTLVAQHMLTRLLVVDELVAWDWLNSQKTRHSSDWNINTKGKGLLFPPDNLQEWFDDEINGLKEQILKQEALVALKKPDKYTETH
ncbi:uncharacterized protein BJ212DRAFT_1304613 [Suillus subaureus]|uniref:Uncharacterized protein n=1 Tax=Suillus subaureus TaxID=48587 RepID=A0A9P7DU47_9AGAM|nr:uncharacterized protein BJ212DRAFT_1304613 [Suillus subaureus]KAG1803286.1 hypothetical protein BJ212DRAFT_1304613 [Suillus subaureus]